MTISIVGQSPLGAMIQSPLGVLAGTVGKYGYNLLRRMTGENYNDFAIPPIQTNQRCLTFFELNHEDGENVVAGSIDIGTPIVTTVKTTFIDLTVDYTKLINYALHTVPALASNLDYFQGGLFNPRYALDTNGKVFYTNGTAEVGRVVINKDNVAEPFKTQITGQHLVLQQSNFMADYGEFVVFSIPNTNNFSVVTIPKAELPINWTLTNAYDAVITVTNVIADVFVEEHIGINGSVFQIKAPANATVSYTVVLSDDGLYNAKLIWNGSFIINEANQTVFTGTWSVSYETVEESGYQARAAVGHRFIDLRALVNPSAPDDVGTNNFYVAHEAEYGVYLAYYDATGAGIAVVTTDHTTVITSHPYYYYRYYYTTDDAPNLMQTYRLAMSGGLLILGAELSKSVSGQNLDYTLFWRWNSAAGGYHIFHDEYTSKRTWEETDVLKTVINGELTTVYTGSRGVGSYLVFEPAGGSPAEYTPEQNWEPDWEYTWGAPHTPPDDATSVKIFPTQIGTFYTYTGTEDFLWLDNTLIATIGTPLATPAAPVAFKRELSKFTASGSTGRGTVIDLGAFTGPSSPALLVTANDYDVHYEVSDVFGSSAVTRRLTTAGFADSLPTPIDSQREITIFAPNLVSGTDGVCAAHTTTIAAFLNAWVTANSDPNAAPADLSSHYTIDMNNFAPRSLIEYCLAASISTATHYFIFSPVLGLPRAGAITTGDPPVIIAVPDDVINPDEAYAVNLYQSGAKPIVWEIITGPAGASIHPITGLLSWAGSSTKGEYNWVVKATNYAGSVTAAWTTTVGVVVSTEAPICTPHGNETYSLSSNPYGPGVYIGLFVTTGGDTETFSIESTTTPGAIPLSFDPNNGGIGWGSGFGTPVPDIYVITWRATNAFGFDEDTYTLTLTA